MKKNKSGRKLSFNKASVVLMYLMVIGLFAFCFITTSYPPSEFTYCWFLFWIAQACITCVLQINKRNHNSKTQTKISLLEAITPYINEDNVDQIISKYLDIDPVKKRGDR